MKKHPALSAALSTDTGTPLSAEQIRIRDLVCSTDHSALLQRLLSPGVSKALYSRAVIDFVIAYGKATDAHLPIAEAAKKNNAMSSRLRRVSVMSTPIERHSGLGSMSA